MHKKKCLQTCPLLKKLSVRDYKRSTAGIIIALKTLHAENKPINLEKLNLSFTGVTAKENAILQALVPQCQIIAEN